MVVLVLAVQFPEVVPTEDGRTALEVRGEDVWFTEEDEVNTGFNFINYILEAIYVPFQALNIP